MSDIKVYSTKEKGLTKVIFNVKDGLVSSVIVGNSAVSNEQSFQFYVDDYVAGQIDKCELVIDGLTPQLRLKEGKTLFIPDENERYKKVKEIKELEKRLNELKNAE